MAPILTLADADGIVGGVWGGVRGGVCARGGAQKRGGGGSPGALADLAAPHIGSGIAERFAVKMSDDEQQEQTIAEDLVVTKYKMGGDIANRKFRVN